MAVELKNTDGSHIPCQLVVPNGTAVNQLGKITLAWDASRPLVGNVVEVLDGPLKGYTVVVPRGIAFAELRPPAPE